MMAAAGVGLFLGLAAALGAQSLYDPDDAIYRHLAVWELKGYLAPLPALRPYAPQAVAAMLRRVARVGDRRARALAEVYLRALEPRARGRLLDAGPPFAVTGFGGIAMAGGTDTPASGVAFGAGLESTALGPGLFAYAGGIRYWWESIRQPRLSYQVPPAYMFDNVGPDFEPFEARADLRALAAFGTPTVHVQAGFVQRAFGSALHDSVVLGAGAAPAAQLTVTYRSESFIYSAAFLDLLADQAVCSGMDKPHGACEQPGQRYSLRGSLTDGGRFPSKYLMVHAVQWHPSPWLSFDLFTATLFGGRISLYALLPTAALTEPYNLNYDNVFGGISTRLRLPFDLSLSATLYVDDFQLFEGTTFNPNPLDNKTAGLAAVAWAPYPLPGVITLDYLFVAPYTYTHSRHQPINYLTYTHRSQPLGSRLPPNSDQWTLAAVVTPLPEVDLEARARAIRHGNASDRPGHDGTIWDDGYVDRRASFVGRRATFLTQNLLEEVFQFEFAVVGRLVLPAATVRGRVNYGLEHIRNRNLESGATATNHTFGAQVEMNL